MNWESFSADIIQSWVVTSDGNRREQARLTSSNATSSFSVFLGERSETVQLETLFGG